MGANKHDVTRYKLPLSPALIYGAFNGNLTRTLVLIGLAISLHHNDDVTSLRPH